MVMIQLVTIITIGLTFMVFTFSITILRRHGDVKLSELDKIEFLGGFLKFCSVFENINMPYIGIYFLIIIRYQLPVKFQLC